MGSKPCNSLLACAGILIGCCSATLSWAGATLDGSTGPTGSFSGAGPGFTIPHTVGETHGSNLFHSFSDFNINAGESAMFTGPGSLNNVISRVTGSGTSTFNGGLTALIDFSAPGGPAQTGANFIFINPNGLIFKEGANLNIGGAFTATTSDFVRLGEDGVYYADLNTTSTLTSSAPAAFGFLDSNPGKISFEGTQLVRFVNLNPATPMFSFVGGDISLDEAAEGTATNFGTETSRGTFLTSNRVELVSVGSAGEAVPANGAYDLGSFDTLGNIEIANGSVIDATEVYIRGGQVVIDDSVIAPGFFFVADMGPFAPNGGSVTISGSESVDIIGSGGPLAIEVNVPPAFIPPEEAGPRLITRFDGGPLFAGVSTFAGDPFLNDPASDVPDVLIEGGDVSLTDSAALISQRFGPGEAGDIVINGDTVEIRNGSLVVNLNTYAGAGGDITIDASEVILDSEGNTTPISGLTGLLASSAFSPVFGDPALDPGFDGSAPPDNSLIYASDLSSADAGNITVNATGPGGLIVLGADITTESRSYGKAGNITVNATDIVLSREGGEAGAIISQSGFAGDAGHIDVSATGNIELKDGYVISASISGTGTGGNVSVTAGKDISITGINAGQGSSGIGSSTVLPPAELEGQLAFLYGFNGDFQTMAAVFTGNPEAGLFDVLAVLQAIGLADLGGANPVAGNAGAVSITASTLSISGDHAISSSTSSDGNGGAINIQVDSLSMDNGAEIRSRSGLVDADTAELLVGAGNGGDIFITATSDISMESGSSISVTSLGDGLAGNISIDAGTALGMSGSSITSEAEGAGNGGDISVTASIAVTMQSNSSISASSLGAGHAGKITVNSADITLLGSSITSRAEGAGDGGAIDMIASNSVSMDGGSSISASSLGVGKAGNISVDAGKTLDMSDSSITSQAEGAGDGGDISVVATSSIAMNNGASISSSSFGAGFAGNISIDAGNRFDMYNSSITTQAVESDGGDIKLVADYMIYLEKSEITTSVESGAGAGGNIDIDPEFVILKQSDILANAFGGPGGNIDIVAGNFIATPDSTVDASSALGIDGTVNISSPDENVSEDLAVLPDNYLDVTSLMSERCGTTAGASSLVDAGPGGQVVDPDGYLPSFAAATNPGGEVKAEIKSASQGKYWWAAYTNQNQPGLQLTQITCTY